MENHISLRPCFIFVTIFLLFISNIQSSAAASSSTLNVSKIFIKTTCSKTSYPKVCYSSLSPYASDVGTSLKKLAKVSLNVALETSKTTSLAISKILKQKGLKAMEVAIVKDCVENVKDNTYEVKLCLAGLKTLNGTKSDQSTIDSIKTWLSAAITDEDTCMDGFEGDTVKGSIQGSIRKYIVKLAMLTSNSLAIIGALSQTLYQ